MAGDGFMKRGTYNWKAKAWGTVEIKVWEMLL